MRTIIHITYCIRLTNCQEEIDCLSFSWVYHFVVYSKINYNNLKMLISQVKNLSSKTKQPRIVSKIGRLLFELILVIY